MSPRYKYEVLLRNNGNPWVSRTVASKSQGLELAQTLVLGKRNSTWSADVRRLGGYNTVIRYWWDGRLQYIEY